MSKPELAGMPVANRMRDLSDARERIIPNSGSQKLDAGKFAMPPCTPPPPCGRPPCTCARPCQPCRVSEVGQQALPSAKK